MEQPTLTVALVALSVLLVVILVVLVSRRRARQPGARLRSASSDLLEQVLIPDGNDGEIHIEYALLCPRGIVVVNLKQAKGNVFGSDTMQEWAVLTGQSRYGFPNPQDGLYDRVAAVRGLVDDVPVDGFIAFTEGAEFTKGVPSHVVMFDSFINELLSETDSPGGVEAHLPGWEKLKAAAS